MKSQFRALLLPLVLAGLGGSVQAGSLEETTAKAVTTSPDVMVKWRQFNAIGHERDISWGRNLPTLDLTYGTARERKESPLLGPGVNDYNTTTQRITLKQNLFEGFATQNDVKRLDHAGQVRYFEYLDSAETAAQEAGRAYIDVFRFRKLVEMAEENYAVHRLVYDKLAERTKAGVSRGVDLEMAAGRLALSESNLLTEASNLHDATARYLRVVGEAPPADLQSPPSFGKLMPATRADAIVGGYKNSPQLKAALKNLHSAQSNIEVQRADRWPRVDAFAQASREKNASGVIGNTDTNTVGVTVTWNLFDGLRGNARAGKAVEESHAADALRVRVCRDVRQALQTSHNEHVRLSQQLPLLDQHQLSMDKAREALRRQFDIGQRTLLDVLDTENEYYTARRNYLNGEMDQNVAQVRYLAAAGNLVQTLKAKRIDDIPADTDPTAANDAATLCPPEPVPLPERKPVPVKTASYITLLENADGTTGKVSIKCNTADILIDRARFGAALDCGEQPALIDEEKIRRDFGEAMAAQPKLPTRYMLLFKFGKSELTKESAAELPKILGDMEERQVGEVTVVGHTDTVGGEKQNDKLGLSRAKFAEKVIKAKRPKLLSMTTDTRGERELKVKTKDNVAEPRNRRVEISVR